MPERFYAPVDLTQPVTLQGAEAHHLTNVLRVRPGDRVVLFDGNGTEAAAEVTSSWKRAVELQPREVRRDPVAAAEIVLGTAVPKGERFRWLVEKATELGIDRLVPLETERSVVDPREGKLDKMRQVVIAACKQCGRNRLMEIEPAMAWKEFVAREGSDGQLIVADPHGRPARELFAMPATARVSLAVGPEGGYTEAELIAAGAAGAVRINLGRSILRIETAAIALAALARVATATGGRDEYGEVVGGGV